MKRLSAITGMILILLFAHSCQWLFPDDETIDANFEDSEDMSIYDFLVENDSLYGNFLKILEAGNVAKTLSAYNPYNQGYTLFLPDTFAVEEYIQSNPNYATLEDLLADTEFVTALAEYHVVNLAIEANDFPFGALPVATMTDDYLTVNFVIEQDSAFYKINNQAPVAIEDLELSNGFIHVLSSVLRPISYTTFDWLADREDYSIFTAAVEATGFSELLSTNIKDDSATQTAVTLLLEPDSIYNKQGIYSMEDLVTFLGIEETDYTRPSNPFHQYVGYHILDSYSFLDDFYDNATNYTTFSNLPININGDDFIDIVINKYKYAFDTIIEDIDTTIIDYVTFNYDESNISTLSGAIHLVDNILYPVPPSRATQTFHQWEEPFIANLRNDDEPGEYAFEEPNSLRVLSWTGVDPVFIIEADEDYPAWDDDYILFDGNFSLKYKLPKIVQGEYRIIVRAHSNDETNAVIEVYLDGAKVGGFTDFTTGGSDNNPYNEKRIGEVDLPTYEAHEIEIRTLIPGRFEWDWVRFSPITD